MSRLVSLLLVSGFLLLAACRTSPESPLPAGGISSLPVRFLLTFDDGPSGQPDRNTTAEVLNTLAHNHWQSGIKAIFFVQTRAPHGGGTPVGQSLMERIHAEGHLLELHSGSPRGHINNTLMPLAELDQSLDNGIHDIRRVSGESPRFIRPPFWAYKAETVEHYETHGLTMLLDDITIRDGKVRGYTSNPHARAHIHADLERAARRIQAGELPAVSGYIPLVVTMHDTNPTTARDLELYLGMLIEEARRVGLTVDTPAFVAPAAELDRVASVRGNRRVFALHADGHLYR